MSNEKSTDLHTTKVGINAVNNIFIKWGFTLEEKLAFLGLSEPEYILISDPKKAVNLSDELNKRISYILNIYECLHVLFSNPENRYNFLKLSNNSNLFSGISPVEYMVKRGTTSALSDIYHYIDGMRHY
ncbi:MAG: hypothetical protein RPT25_04530 [Cycloclasticus sp.]|jgi:hypothetical protein